MPTRSTGTVAKWLNHKGIGFITPDGNQEGDPDVLVHYQQIKQESEDGFKSLQQEARSNSSSKMTRRMAPRRLPSR